jgi:hypothetical protein
MESEKDLIDKQHQVSIYKTSYSALQPYMCTCSIL